MLIAAELLLLALDPARGAPVNGSRSPLAVALSGALVAELGLLGAVDVSGRRFVPTSATRVDEPLLADALRVLGQPRGRRSVDQLRRLDRQVGGVWSRLVDGLCEGKVLGRRRDRQLFWQVTRHPVLRTDLRDEVVRRLRAAAAGSGSMDPRTAVLLALSGPARLLEVVAPSGADRGQAKRRIREATDSTPVAPVVKRVIAEAQAAAASASVIVVAASS